MLTFLVCGALHDLITMAIRGAVIGRWAGMDTKKRPWTARAGINLTYIVACLALTIVAKQFLKIP